MYRCDRRFALGLLASTLGLGLPAATSAQELVSRAFPATALRGVITLQSPSEALLNGQAVTLAPGLRIRGTNNLLVLSGAILGQKFTGHYVMDFQGQIKDLWILRPDEIARFWPRSSEEAAARSFDPAAQTWTKR